MIENHELFLVCYFLLKNYSSNKNLCHSDHFGILLMIFDALGLATFVFKNENEMAADAAKSRFNVSLPTMGFTIKCNFFSVSSWKTLI